MIPHLTVPGRHEARALTVRCPLCASLTRPAVVLDCPDYRQAGYGCACGHRWIRTHKPAGVAV